MAPKRIAHRPLHPEFDSFLKSMLCLVGAWSVRKVSMYYFCRAKIARGRGVVVQNSDKVSFFKAQIARSRSVVGQKSEHVLVFQIKNCAWLERGRSVVGQKSENVLFFRQKGRVVGAWSVRKVKMYCFFKAKRARSRSVVGA